jgi:DNA-binding response OmpR family regulator
MNSPSQGHVLYLEDHDDTRVLMTILLEQAGFEVTPTRLGAEFLKQAKEGRFDLYLLDHTFPDSSGTTVCMATREFDQETPILFTRPVRCKRERGSDERRSTGLSD